MKRITVVPILLLAGLLISVSPFFSGEVFARDALEQYLDTQDAKHVYEMDLLGDPEGDPDDDGEGDPDAAGDGLGSDKLDPNLFGSWAPFVPGGQAVKDLWIFMLPSFLWIP